MPFLDDQIKFARKAADQTHAAVLGFFGDKGQPGATATITATVLAALVLVLAVMLTVALGVIFRIGAQVAALFLETMEEARHDNQDALNSLIAASMSDLLSVEVTAEDIPKGGDAAAQLDRARVIGGKLHDLLIAEFGGNAGPEGVDGEKAARAFSGFNINFNTSAAFLSIITEIESLGYFKQFREIGEMMAQGLGLGRLHRAALRPLVDHLITQPYGRQLGARYRQTRLTPAQYVFAAMANKLDSVALHDHLAEAGYRDDDIPTLIDLLSKKLGAGDLAQLERAGRTTREAAITALSLQGYSPADADGVMLAQQLGRDEGIHGQYVHDAFNLARQRHMSEAEFQGVLDAITMPESEKQLWAQRLSLHLLHPTKRIGLAQLVFLGERNQITDAEVDAWVEAEGYDAVDAGLIHLYVLGKEFDRAAAEKAKADKAKKAAEAAAAKAAAAAAKAKPPGNPPPA